VINYRYKILRKLGEGGSGEVYLVEDTLRENWRVAMKVLRTSDQTIGDDEKSFRAEISTLLQLSHPNLIQVFDCGMIRSVDHANLGDRRYYTMEIIDGTDALAWCGLISDPESKAALLESLLFQSLSVLFYVHREGIIHYDIKPQNLMVVGVQAHDVIPVLKLTDFGFSVRGKTPSDLSLRGTLEYAAPELLQGEPVDHRIDLYSLGAAFYHLVEGRCPFEAAEPVELIKMALTQEALFVRAAHPAYDHLRRVIGLLMARNPAKRCQTAKEAGEILAADRGDLMRHYFGYLSVPRFVGRKNQKEMIISALRRLGRGAEAGGPTRVRSCANA
jgi:serine/threonine protein kinase